jgi:hypothetical protein
MSPTGRPEGKSLSAQREGIPMSPTGHPEGESLSAQREGGPSGPTGRPEGESPSAGPPRVIPAPAGIQRCSDPGSPFARGRHPKCGGRRQ